MKKLIIAAVLLMFSGVAVAFSGFPGSGDPSQVTQDAFEQYAENIGNMSLAIEGTGNGSFRTISGESEPVWCFTDIPMYDRKSGLLVGYAEDCLAGVTANENGGVSVLPGYTYLRFFAPGGTWDLVVSGNISVIPTVVQTETQYGAAVSHITGSSKESTLIGNGVKGNLSTGLFKNARGQGRISGMVNMANFDPANVEGSSIDFSCYFNIVDLELSSFAVRDVAETL